MYIKFICVALVSFAILQDAYGKKSKKKRINNDDNESTPQPNVLTYSTFGFNDVGSYDGFVPSSPDFTNYLTKSQESSTRLYAPAFPSAIDTTGLGSYYDPQTNTGPLNVNSDVTGNENPYQPYQGVSINFFTSPNLDIRSEDREITEPQDLHTDDINSPIYGAKLSSKSKNKHLNNFNRTEFNIFDSVSSVINDNTANINNGNNYPRIPSASSAIESDKIVSSNINPSNSLKFTKFVDFTDVKNYYPTSVESKYQESMQKPIVVEPIQNNEGENNYQSFHNSPNNEQKVEQTYKNKLKFANDQLKYDKDMKSFKNEEIQNSNTKRQKIYIKPNTFNSDTKENMKTRPVNNNNERKRIRNPLKGYEYATNYSTTSFKFDYEPKRPFNNNIDEISPASSNLEFVDYKLPEKEFSGFKNIHDIKSYDIDNLDILSSSYQNKYKLSEDNLNSFKNLYTTVPSVTSQWGNIFKNSEFSPYKSHSIKSYFNDDSSDDVIYIPKKQKNKFGKNSDFKINDFSISNNYKPYKINDNKPEYEWPKDFFNTRFKSEEDLLGLRNHDTAYPYQPSFKPSYSDFAEEIDYKKLAQKWKNNYLKSKYRDAAHREYESYASETKPVHVPLPKPYPIEIPHPVIVPVPQPYPVKVPIPKPVAVPVIRELTVPIEKPVPYPVIKKVPYPIEKLVPVPVEKQVHVPVIKPYPVHIPQIRPVFHHTKGHDYDDSDVDEDEYAPRPDTKRPVYKRPKTSHNRPRSPSRRPSRMTYQDRIKKRVPSRRPGHYDQRPRRPYQSEHRPHRHRDVEEYDSDSEFDIYCRKTGRC